MQLPFYVYSSEESVLTQLTGELSHDIPASMPAATWVSPLLAATFYHSLASLGP